MLPRTPQPFLHNPPECSTDAVALILSQIQPLIPTEDSLSTGLRLCNTGRGVEGYILTRGKPHSGCPLVRYLLFILARHVLKGAVDVFPCQSALANQLSCHPPIKLETKASGALHPESWIYVNTPHTMTPEVVFLAFYAGPY